MCNPRLYSVDTETPKHPGEEGGHDIGQRRLSDARTACQHG